MLIVNWRPGDNNDLTWLLNLLANVNDYQPMRCGEGTADKGSRGGWNQSASCYRRVCLVGNG